MRIVQINTFSYKAAGNIMMNLHKAMLNEGIDSYVAWGRGRKAENDHEYYMNDDFGVKMHGAFTRITDKHGFGSKKATENLLEWIDNINPDVIHLHCIHGYYINIELLFNYIKENGIKVVWTQHDCWAFTGHCAYFDAVGCFKWKKGCYKCEQLSTYPSSIIRDNSRWNWGMKKKLFSGLNMTIVTPCKWLSELVKESYLGNYPIQVIYNGINTSIFKPTKSIFKKDYYIENKKIILGVASEWTERKGLKDFVELNEVINKREFVIVIVGVNKRQKKMLPQDIVCVERTENVKQLAAIYTAAYVYFNPTYEDNYPTVNLESICCGTPVVTYNTGGSPEALCGEKYGIVIEKKDYARILTYVRDIYYKKFKCDFTDKSFFDENRMVIQYLELYKSILDK